MKSYTFDVRLTGYEQITVKAKDIDKAREKALQRFEDIYIATPAWDLRSKAIELEPLSGNAQEES
jgi:hypothetical protein